MYFINVYMYSISVINTIWSTQTNHKYQNESWDSTEKFKSYLSVTKTCETRGKKQPTKNIIYF